MSGDNHFKLSSQQTLCQLHSYQMCQFRTNLSLCETLYQMEALHLVCFMKSFFCSNHILICLFYGTANGIFKKHLLCFIPVQCIVDCFFQRTGSIPFLLSLFFIPDIVYRTVQAVNGNNTCICNKSSPHFPYFFPDFSGYPQHFVDTLLAGSSCCIGNVCQLIRIITQSCNFP